MFHGMQPADILASLPPDWWLSVRCTCGHARDTPVALLARENVDLIDCQQRTSHLASLGGRAIRRADFQAHLTAAVDQPPIDWQSYAQAPLNPLLLPTD
jgi:hypothetical protein